MPPQRRPLFPTDGNRPRGPETDPYTRGKITGLHIAGITQCAIMWHTDASRKAVRGSIALEILNTNGASLPRPGRPIIYDARDKRSMLRCLRLEPKLTFDQRWEATGLNMSNGTIKNIARENSLSHWRAKARPALTPEVAALRLTWCLKRRHWKTKEWRKYMWSDECSAEWGKGKKRSWVWGTPSDKWKPAFVDTYRKGKDLRVMVWAMFWGEGERSCNRGSPGNRGSLPRYGRKPCIRKPCIRKPYIRKPYVRKPYIRKPYIRKPYAMAES